MLEFLFLIFLYANPDYAAKSPVPTLFWDFEDSGGGFKSTPPKNAWCWGRPYWAPAYSGINAWTTCGLNPYHYYSDRADWRLESPCVMLDSAGGCTLSFFHWYLIEYYWDGGNLKISTDYGASWTIIHPFEPYKYPCDSASYANYGIPNEPCFSGNTPNFQWVQAKFLLDDYAGKIVMIRWHFGSDPCDTAPGWYIDDVRITNASGLTKDVASTAIIKPVSKVIPNVTIYPQICYRNFGIDTETIYVYLKIDSAGINIYRDSLNLILEPDADTEVKFKPWTNSGTEGITYDITTYTVLAGDQYPLNDTLIHQTVVTSRFWELLPTPFPLPSSGHSLASRDDGTYMVFGIRIPGIYLDTTLIYDIANDAWLGGPKNPFGPASYGTAHFVGRKFYRIGGTNNFPNPLNRVDIFDPITGSWSAGAPSPIGLIDHISGVYKDSLIFTFGNGNWDYPVTNQVSFYDVYTNSWGSATPFPGAGRGACAGGIIDSFAILSCGFQPGGIFCQDYIVGIINSSQPSNIAWGEWKLIPGTAYGRYRVPCGVDKVNKELWLVGGKIYNGETAETWSYNPYTDTWTNWNVPKTYPVGNVTPIVITKTVYGTLGVFVPSGYHANTYISAHEFFHKGSLGLEEEQATKVPTKPRFLTVSPNPAKAYVSISYLTAKMGSVTINLYDNSGRLVKTLVKRTTEPPGTKTVYWNCKDNNHRRVSDGVYFLQLVCEDGIETKKLVLIE